MKLAILAEVRRHIRDYPERFCAANWAWAANVRDVLASDAQPLQFRCCIAGHALLLGGAFDEAGLLKQSVRYDDGYLGRCAQEVLELTDAQRRALFYPTQWAEPYRSRYYLAPDRPGEAQAAAAFLTHFISEATTAAPKLRVVREPQYRPPAPRQALLPVGPEALLL